MTVDSQDIIRIFCHMIPTRLRTEPNLRIISRVANFYHNLSVNLKYAQNNLKVNLSSELWISAIIKGLAWFPPSAFSSPSKTITVVVLLANYLFSRQLGSFFSLRKKDILDADILDSQKDTDLIKGSGSQSLNPETIGHAGESQPSTAGPKKQSTRTGLKRVRMRTESNQTSSGSSSKSSKPKKSSESDTSRSESDKPTKTQTATAPKPKFQIKKPAVKIDKHTSSSSSSDSDSSEQDTESEAESSDGWEIPDLNFLDSRFGDKPPSRNLNQPSS